jgi:transcriptional regulator with XRE-family HTH domain
MTAKQNKETGKRIYRLRKDAGLTQASLAMKADLSPNTIARLERGKHEISNDSVKKLSKALGKTPNDILGY